MPERREQTLVDADAGIRIQHITLHHERRTMMMFVLQKWVGTMWTDQLFSWKEKPLLKQVPLMKAVSRSDAR